LVVDYADLIQPPVRYKGQQWLELMRTYTALRLLLRRHSMAGWTGSQMGVGGHDRNEEADGRNVAGSYGKLGIVDAALLFLQSQKEWDEGKGRFKTEAVRDRVGGQFVPVYVDLDRSRILSTPPLGSIPVAGQAQP
jgi:hypothetical protein